MKWLFAALLVLQAHFAASYLVPLDREAQGDPQTEAPWTGSRAGSPPGPCRS
jgi:hypothetical protein